MTKKHFKDLAHMLRKSRIRGHGLSTASERYIHEQWCADVEAVAYVCKFYNPKFNRERFYEACGRELE
jgi:hypothetical protein